MYNLARTAFAFLLAIIPTNALADITVEQIRDAKGIAHILRLEVPCGYRISDHALQRHYKANDLFTPVMLALIIREMKKPVGSPSQYECATATANALHLKLLVEERVSRATLTVRTVSMPDIARGLRGLAMPLHEQVKVCWNPPYATKGLSASMRATLGQDGRVNGIETIKGSGNTVFDESAWHAILRCGPYSLPQFVEGETASFVVKFDGSR